MNVDVTAWKSQFIVPITNEYIQLINQARILPGNF